MSSSDELNCVKISGGNGVARSRFDLPGLEGRLFSRPAGGDRGGDLHVLSACLEARISRLVVADAAGHGPVVAGASEAILEALRDLHHVVDNAGILETLDRHLPARGLATATSATLHVDSGELLYGYAGPPMAFHFARSEAAWSHLSAVCSIEAREGFVGLPLGVLPGGSYCQSRTKLDPGDLLVLFTDGLLGRGGLDDLLEKCRAVANPDADTVEEALWGPDGGEAEDDLTVVVALRV